MTSKEAFEILRDTPIDLRSTREDDIYTLYATAQHMALEALEKQIPKKPIVNLWDEWCECPGCNGIVTFEEIKYDFCPDCGQAIDWSEK